jgi:6,7-dimethyl-8-ribityllumazine synthase
MKNVSHSTKIVTANPLHSFVIVISEFNKNFTKEMLLQAKKTFAECGANLKEIIWVPGAFELPIMAQKACKEGADVVLSLGVVIRGETNHYDYVCESAAKGIMDVSLKHNKPVIFGVLTCENEQQVIERIPGVENLAKTAVSMANLFYKG